MTTKRSHRTRPPLLVGLTAAALAAVAVAACGGKPPVAQFQKEQRIEQDMEALVREGIPGVAVAINEGDHITTMATGVGEVATAAPLGTEDKLRIGSITKSYTAVVALQLAGEGALSLDDTVERWLPGLVTGGSGITVGQLLNHTSGIADYEVHPAYLEPYLTGDLGHVTSPEQLVGYAEDLGAETVPAGRARYSNTNYVLVGMIVEEATRTPLATHYQQRIFEPLGLEDTSYPVSPELPEPFAHGYLVIDQPPAADVTGLSPTMAGAGGGLVSTVGDVATFYRALFNGELLEPGLLDRMMETLPEDQKQLGYGLQAIEQPCGTVWGHGGNFPGYLVFAWSTAGGEHQAVVAMNTDPSSLGSSEAQVEDLVSTAVCGPTAAS